MAKRLPLIVIGGGAAGILAAWKAASLGARVILAERNPKLGIKLLISGGGKCNITHAGAMEEVRSAFPTNEARFLKPAFYKFSNADIVAMLEARGVETMTRPNGRVFPRTGRADDVVNALADYLKMTNVEVLLKTRVSGICSSAGSVQGVLVDDQLVPSSHVILATGGASYPKTGTTGDGFVWAERLGHTIVPVRPALAPIAVEPKLPPAWRGVALRGGCLMVFADGKKIFAQKEDILFSHEGITGPAALECSRVAAEARAHHRVELRFDFFPGKDFIQLDEEFTAFVLSRRDKMVSTLLDALLPNRLVPALLAAAHVDGTIRGHVLTRSQRRSLVQIMKDWKLGDVARVDLERGEVTAGGVALNEIDPQTMRSRIIRGLYVCGEVLDIAGPVGGYNLQAAFSTGYVAGESAALDWLDI